jgi:glutamyl-tRNA(Gln) amidotransferase subunit E
MNYKELGFKCGLEVHQQLDTKKLFIRTPSVLEEETNIKIERKLNPTGSELGEIDQTAIDAFKRKETFFYEGNKQNISLVELDEEPPQPIDEEALKTVLEIALLCNSKIVSEATIMRKTIIDGSNTSAFQRTMLLSIGGNIKINDKKNIGVETIAIEEDACRPIKKENNKVYYNLDRLGIPLIELATAPDIKSPEEAFETAKKIGEIFRLTGKTKRGKGTIRQDVNISITNGNRCEIKGCQELDQIKLVTEKEIERQLDLINLKKELNEKIKNKKELFSKIIDISKVFEKSNCKFAKGKEIFGIKIKEMNGFLGKKIGPKRFGSELSAYAKSCGVTGLIHKDELPNYGIVEEEKEKVSKMLNCNNEDNFVFIIAEKEKATKAFETIQKRILIAFEEVPKETRGMEEDGSSTYQRPLSSGTRMYPETDLPKEMISEEQLKKIKTDLPKSVSEREKNYKKLGLSINHINEMKLNNYARFFEKIVKKGANPIVGATLLLQTLKELKRENIKTEEINENQLEELLLLESNRKINKNDLKNTIKEITKGKTIQEILKETTNKLDENEINKIIIQIIEKNKNLIREKKLGAIGPLMGDLMREEKLKGIDGKLLSELLKKEILKVIK